MGSNGENDRPPKGQGEYVFLDNLPETANQILNVLWIENREMSVEEMTERVNQEFSTNRDRETVKQFLKMLVKWDYAEKKRHGLKVNYIALGAEYLV